MRKQGSAVLTTCLLVIFLGSCALFQSSFDDDRDLIIIRPVKRLGSYQNVEFKAFSSNVDKIYSGLVKDINDNISKRLRDGGFNTFTGKTLLITGKVMRIEEGFSHNNVIVRVELKDKSTGNSLGIANVRGKVETDRGLKAAAAEVATNVVNLVTEYGFRKTG